MNLFANVNFMKSKYISSISDNNLASELTCAVRIVYTLDSEDLVWKKECKIAQ